MIKKSKIPHAVRLNLTKKCNLHCDFCLADASSEADKDELSTDEWLKFFERLKELKIFMVSLSGGEIFLRDDLFVLLKKLRENRMHRLTLLTNGTLITKNFAEQLKQLKIKTISISIDGMEANHNRLRGPGSFEKSITVFAILSKWGLFPIYPSLQPGVITKASVH